MDIAKFEELAEQLREAKVRIREARSAHEAAKAECDAAHDNESRTYREFMTYVRESAHLSGDAWL